MKTKQSPKFVILTTNDISIGEFKNKRELNCWLKVYKDDFRPVLKILSGAEIKNSTYHQYFRKDTNANI